MKTVNLRHPGYADECNILLTLPALDHPNGGFHAETARLACCVVAGNRWDGFLSARRQDIEPVEPKDGVLLEGDYYFHLPSDSPEGDDVEHAIDKRNSKTGPYLIIVRFADWTFPVQGLPPIWQAARDATERLTDRYQDGNGTNEEEIDIAEKACSLCGASEETDFVWLWDHREKRVFERECAKISVNARLRVTGSVDILLK